MPNDDGAIGVVDLDARTWWLARGPKDRRRAWIDLASRTWWDLPGGPEGWVAGTDDQGGAVVVAREPSHFSHLEVFERE